MSDAPLTFAIKRGDTLPVLGPVELRNPDGGTPNLDGATIKFILRPFDGLTLALERTAIVHSMSAASAKYPFTVSDTVAKGRWRAEFEVTFPDGSRMTYPNATEDGTAPKYIDVYVHDDLNSDGVAPGLTAGQMRVVLKGTAAVGAGITVDLSAAFIRQAGERVSWDAWISEASASLSFSRPPAAGVGVWVWLDRTTNPDEAKLRATNLDGSTRTVDWTIMAVN